MHVPPCDVDIYISGSKLKTRQAMKLICTTYPASSEGRKQRIQLLSFLMHRSIRDSRKLELYSNELIKFINDEPSDAAHQLLSFPVKSDHFERCKECWLRQVNMHDPKVEILVNAASFCSHQDPTTAEQLYIQAISLDKTNYGIIFELCELHLAYAEVVTQRLQRIEKMCSILQDTMSKFDLTDANLTWGLNGLAARAQNLAQAPQQQRLLDTIQKQLTRFSTERPSLRIISPEFFENLDEER